MAKEVVYKPIIDLSELPQQMEALQAQMSLAMGAQAFGNTPTVTAPFSDAASSLLSGPSFSEQVSSSISSSFRQINDVNASVASQINQASEAMRLGSYKFHDTLQLRGLMSPVNDVLSTDFSIDSVERASFSEAGFFKASFGAMGFGFDPNTAGMTKADYQANAEKRMQSADWRADQTSLWGGLGLGAAAGALTGNPLVGIAVDLGVDYTFGKANEFLNRHNVERERIADYVKGGSFRFAGGAFSAGESTRIASDLQGIFDSRELSRLEISQTQAESMISEFTSGGGFDSVSTAEEYTSKVKELMESSQKVAQLLHTSLREATSTMAGLEQAGITSSPVETLELVQRMESRSGIAGMTTNEYMNLGMAGANMVQGTGIDFASGFGGIQSAALGLRQGLAAGNVDASTLRHLGGLESAAGMITQRGLDYGTGSMGMVLNAAGPGALSGNIQDVFSAAASNVNSAGDLLSIVGSQTDFASKQGPLALAVSNMAMIGQEFNMALGKSPESMDELVGFMLQTNKVRSPAEARALIGMTASLDPTSIGNASLDRARDIAQAEIPGTLDKLREGWGDVKHWFKGIGDSISYYSGSSTDSEEVEITGRMLRSASSEDIAASRAYQASSRRIPGRVANLPGGKGAWSEGERLDIELAKELPGLNASWSKAAEEAGYSNVTEFVGDVTSMGSQDLEDFLSENDMRYSGIGRNIRNFASSERGKLWGARARGYWATVGGNTIAKQLTADFSDSLRTTSLHYGPGVKGRPDNRNQNFVGLRSKVKDLMALTSSGKASTEELASGYVDVAEAVIGTKGVYRNDLVKAGFGFMDNEAHVSIMRELRDADTREEREAIVQEKLSEGFAIGGAGADAATGVNSADSFKDLAVLSALMQNEDFREFMSILQDIVAAKKD